MIGGRPASAGWPGATGAPDHNQPFRVRRRRIVELGVVLLLLGPSVGLSFFTAQREPTSFWLVASSTILSELGLLALLGYFAWINGEQLRDLGWRFDRGWIDLLLGFVCFAPLTLSASILARVLERVGVPGPPTSGTSLLTVTDLPEALVATLLVVVVAVTEETLFRGYLIRRFGAVAASVPAAVVASTVIFALGHGYEGVTGVLTVGYLGGAFAIVYVWRRSLVAPAVMHFLQDLLAIVVIPLMH